MKNILSDPNIKLAAIVAMGKDRAIGSNGKIPWHLPEDLKHFKEITSGNTIIMGRKTWESLPHRPLPGRDNIVISRNPDYVTKGALLTSSLQNAIEAAEGDIAFVIGGESIYREALPFCSLLYLTLVDIATPYADTFFPEISSDEWKTINESEQFISESGIHYKYLTLNRIK